MSERLYRNLPTIHRHRDQEQGEPLRALLATIEEELAALEANVDDLYDDSFIETCRDWVVPYLADLVGVRVLGDRPHALAHPRAQVADVTAIRRRKGTPLAIERATRDVTGWFARLVELFEQLAHTQHVQFPRPGQGGLYDVADGAAPLAALADPFAPAQSFHSVDTRRAASGFGQSGFGQSGPANINIPNLALHLWRLRAYALDDSPAVEGQIDGNPVAGGFRFDPLGRDLQLFHRPDVRAELVRQSAAHHLPVALDLDTLDADLQRYRRRWAGEDPAVRAPDSDFYGPGRSLHAAPAGNGAPAIDVVARSLGTWGAPGLMSGDLSIFPTLRQPQLVVSLGGDPRTVTLADLPTGLSEAAAILESAVQEASTAAGDSFAGARLVPADGRLLLLPGILGDAVTASATAADATTAEELGLSVVTGASEVTALLSGDLASFPTLQSPAVQVILGGDSRTVSLADLPTDLPADLMAARRRLDAGLRAASTVVTDSFAEARVALLDNRLLVLPGTPTDAVTVAATGVDTTTVGELGLSVASGQAEAITGLLSAELAPFPDLDIDRVPRIRVTIDGVTIDGLTVETNIARPKSLEQARASLEIALQTVRAEPEFRGARVVRVGQRLLVLPGVTGASVTFADALAGTAVTAPDTATLLGLTSAAGAVETQALHAGEPTPMPMPMPTMKVAPRVKVTVTVGAAMLEAEAVLSRVPADLEQARSGLEEALRRASEEAVFRDARVLAVADRLLVLPGVVVDSVTVENTGAPATASDLRLTTGSGAVVTRGLLSGDLAPFPSLTAAPAVLATIAGEGPHRVALGRLPGDLETLRRALENALRGAHPGPGFADARVALVGSRLEIIPGLPGDELVFAATAEDPDTVTGLGLDAVTSTPAPGAVSGVLEPFPRLRRPTVEVTLGGSVRRTVVLADLPMNLAAAALLLEEALHAAHTTTTFQQARVLALASTLLVVPGEPDDPVAFSAAVVDANTATELGLANGTISSGLLSGALTDALTDALTEFPTLPASPMLDVTIGTVTSTVDLDPPPPDPPIADLVRAAAALEAAIRAASPDAGFVAARVLVVDDRLLVLPGTLRATVTIEAAAGDPDTARLLGLDRSAARTTEALESGDLSVFPMPLSIAPRLRLNVGGEGGEAVLARVPRDVATARRELEAAIRASTTDNPIADARFTAAQVLAVAGRLLILPGEPGLPVAVAVAIAAGDATTALLLDLTWRLALDPLRGRLLFAPGAEPVAGESVRVAYAYGFAADLGGGPYDRRATLADEATAGFFGAVSRSDPSAFATLQDAVDAWQAAGQPDGVIRIADNEIYRQDLTIDLPANVRLTIEAADGARPVLLPATSPTLIGEPGGKGGELTINGLLVDAGFALEDNLSLNLLHTTLAPRPGRPSLSHTLSFGADASDLAVSIASSIVGPLPLPGELASLALCDSLLDAQGTGESSDTLPALVSDTLPDTLRLSSALEMEVTLGAAAPLAFRLTGVPTNLADARRLLEEALRAAGTSTSFTAATVAILGDRLLVRSGDAAETVVFEATATDTRTALELSLSTPPAQQVQGLFSGSLTGFAAFTLPRLQATIGTDGPHIAELSAFPVDPTEAVELLRAALAAADPSPVFTDTAVALLATTDASLAIQESRLLVQPGVAGEQVGFAGTTADPRTVGDLRLGVPPALPIHGLLGSPLDLDGFAGSEIQVTVGTLGPEPVSVAGVPDDLAGVAAFLETGLAAVLPTAFPDPEPNVLLLGDRLLIRPAIRNDNVTVTSTGGEGTSPAELLGLAEPAARDVVGGLLSASLASFAGLRAPQLQLTLDGQTPAIVSLSQIPTDLSSATTLLQEAMRQVAGDTAEVLTIGQRMLLQAGGADVTIDTVMADLDTAAELGLLESGTGEAEDLEGLLSAPIAAVPDFPRPQLEVTLGSVGPQRITLDTLPATPEEARAAVEQAMRAGSSQPAFADARVGVVDGSRLLVLSGDPSTPITVAAAPEDSTTAAELGLTAPPATTLQGLLSGDLFPFPILGRLQIEAIIGAGEPLAVNLDGSLADLDAVRASLDAGFDAASSGLVSVSVAQDRLLIEPVTAGDSVVLGTTLGDPDTLGNLLLDSPSAEAVRGLLSGNLVPFPAFPLPTVRVTLGTAAASDAILPGLPTGLGAAVADLQAAIRAAGSTADFTTATVARLGDRLFVASGGGADTVLVAALPADDPGTAADLALTAASGAEAGLLSGDLSTFPTLSAAPIVQATLGGTTLDADFGRVPIDLADTASALQDTLNNIAGAPATFTAATVVVRENRLLVRPGVAGDAVEIADVSAASATATELTLTVTTGAAQGLLSGDLAGFAGLRVAPSVEVTLGTELATATFIAIPTSLAEAQNLLLAAINAASGTVPFTGALVRLVSPNLLLVTSGVTADPVVIQDPTDPTRAQTATLLGLLGAADGGPAVSVDGLLSGDLSAFAGLVEQPPPAELDVAISGEGQRTVDLGALPVDLEEARSRLENAIGAAATTPGFAGVRVSTVGDDRLLLLPGVAGASIAINASTGNPDLASDLALDPTQTEAARVLLGGVLPATFLLTIAPALDVTFGVDGPHRSTLRALPRTLGEVRALLEQALRAAPGATGTAFTSATVRLVDDRLLIVPGAGAGGSIRLEDPATGTPAASALSLTPSLSRRAEGLLSDAIGLPVLTAATPELQVTIGGAGEATDPAVTATIQLSPAPRLLSEARAALETILRGADSDATFTDARVLLVDDEHLLVIAGEDDTVSFAATMADADTALALALTGGDETASPRLLSAPIVFPVTATARAVTVTFGGVGDATQPAVTAMVTLAAVPEDLEQARDLLEGALRSADPRAPFTEARVLAVESDRLLIRSGVAGDTVVVADGAMAAALGLGAGVASPRGGLLSGALTDFPSLTIRPRVTVTVDLADGTPSVGTASLASLPADLGEARSVLESALRGAVTAGGGSDAAFATVEVRRLGDRLLVIPGGNGVGVTVEETGSASTAAALGLSDGAGSERGDGLLSADLASFAGLGDQFLSFTLTLDGQGPFPAALATIPLTAAEAATELQAVIRAAHHTSAFIAATVQVIVEDRLLVTPGVAGVTVALDASVDDPSTAMALGFDLPMPVALGSLLSGDLSAFIARARPSLAATLGVEGPFTVELPFLPTSLAEAAAALAQGLRSAPSGGAAFDAAEVDVADGRLLVRSVDATSANVAGSAIVFGPTTGDPTTFLRLRLGRPQAIEADGLLSGKIISFSAFSATPRLLVRIGDEGPFPAALPSLPTTPDAARDSLERAVRAAHNSPAFARARVALAADGGAGSRLIVLPGVSADIALDPHPSDALTVRELGFTGTGVRRVGALVSGALASQLTFPPVPPADPMAEVTVAVEGAVSETVTATFPGLSGPLTLDEIAVALQGSVASGAGLRGADSLLTALTGALAGAWVAVVDGDRLVVAPGLDGFSLGFAGGGLAAQLALELVQAVGTGRTGDEVGPPLSLERVTVFGRLSVRELIRASEVLFTEPVLVRRRHVGCLRYSFLPAGSQTPRRFRCQPDLALDRALSEVAVSGRDLEAAAQTLALDRVDARPDEERRRLLDREIARERTRVLARLIPHFTSRRWGDPGYGQLAQSTAAEITTGAENGSEVGAFHPLDQARRQAQLRQLIQELLRFGLDAGVLPRT